jgi:DNA-binding MarR family transcriptional regulator
MTEPEYKKLRRCACTNYRAASRRLTQYYDEQMKPSGLRITQFSILSALAIEGSSMVTQLADLLYIDQTTLTRNLKLLEEENLIEKVQGEDKRSRFIKLSEKGQAALDKALPYWEEAQNRIVNGVGQEKFRAMLKDIGLLLNVAK